MMNMKTFSNKSSPATSSSKPPNESEYSTEKVTSTMFGCLAVNPQTKIYRRFYLFQMICFPFIPILALFVQNLLIFLEQIDAFEETRSVNQQVGVLHSATFLIKSKVFSRFRRLDFSHGKALFIKIVIVL
jgi:hypothetical protein